MDTELCGSTFVTNIEELLEGMMQKLQNMTLIIF